MSKRLMIIGVMFLFSISTAPAQTPSPEALAVARSLISTMKLTDQYKALLPVILMSIKPAVVQGRPEIERDYDAMAAQIGDAYAPYYSSMVDSAASLYASNFTAEHADRPGYRSQGGRGFAHTLDGSAAPERAQNVTAVSQICFRQSMSSSCSGKPLSIPTASLRARNLRSCQYKCLPDSGGGSPCRTVPAGQYFNTGAPADYSFWETLD